LLFEKNTAHPIHLTHFSLAPDVRKVMRNYNV